MRRVLLLTVSALALVCISSARGVVQGSRAMQTSTRVQIRDFDFTDANHGWVLGSIVPCPATCPDLVLWKYDRGQWTARALPRDMDWYSVDFGWRVAEVQFANHDDGWLYGLNLYSTHDGGRSWNQVRLPPDYSPWTGFGPMVARGGRVWAFLTRCSGPLVNPHCFLYRIGTAAVTHDDWNWRRVPAVHIAPLIRSLAMTDGRYPWRLPASVVGDALKAPCGGTMSPYLDGTSKANLWAVCATSPGPGLVQRKVVYRSSDGGTRWRRVWDTRGYPHRLPLTRGTVNGLAVTSSSTAWIAVWRGPLLVSHDGGVSWHAALSGPRSMKLGPVQFTDSRRGWVESYPGTMLHTTDGGHTWHRVLLQPPAP